jgi:hypothetical protein
MNTNAADPVEGFDAPQFLSARVVDPVAGAIHGYAVEGDLALHYRFGEVVLLALTGEPPAREAGGAFEVALIFLSLSSITEAPAHAASLARLCGARDAGVLATGAIGLSEQATAVLDRGQPLLDWLTRPDAPFPQECRPRDDRERARVAQLRQALQARGLVPEVLAHDPGLEAALLGTLHTCGLRQTAQMMAAILLARLACVTAEALTVQPTAFRSYPLDLPHFEYVGERHDRE